MSRSYRTRQPRVDANIRLRRGESPPRIRVREPRRGDVHPIDPGHLLNLLQAAPLEYVLGLRTVELRARPTATVGKPFAEYRPGDKAIILYSLPLTWTWRGLLHEPTCTDSMRRHRGSVAVDGTDVCVRWPSRSRLGFWFWRYVVHHELGHHYRYHYRVRRSLTTRAREEAVADVHASRLFRAYVRRARARKKDGAGGRTSGCS
jgi:hypothetical protein